MTIVSKTGPGTPIGKLAAVPEKAGDTTAEPVAPAGEHAHTNSLSSISGLSPSEHLKATGGNLNVTGAFQSLELVSQEDREKILNGGAGSRGPMPGFMESAFRPAPAKVTTGRAWDAFAAGVKRLFSAIGERLRRPVHGPDVPMPNFNSESKLRMRIIRSDAAMWKEVVKACEKGQAGEQLAVLSATEKFLASPTRSKSEFLKLSGVILQPDPKDTSSQANIEWTLRDQVVAARNARDYNQDKAVALAQAVHDEISTMIRVDYVNKLSIPDERLFAQGKKSGLIQT